MIAILDPRLWLAFLLTMLLSAGAGYLKGGKDQRSEDATERAKAVAQAHQTEQDVQHMQNRATLRYLDNMHAQQEKAHALPKITLAHDCVVPAAVVGVLNDAQRLPGDAGTGPGPSAAGPQADSSCAAELDICKRNYAEVCQPNAMQLTEIQQRWNDVRALINRNQSK